MTQDNGPGGCMLCKAISFVSHLEIKSSFKDFLKVRTLKMKAWKKFDERGIGNWIWCVYWKLSSQYVDLCFYVVEPSP